MTALSWIDNRTLLACEVLLTFIFGLAFLGMKRMYPNLRGATYFSAAFFFGLTGSVLLVSCNLVPGFVSAVIGNGVIFCAFALLYRGTVRFLELKRKPLPVWTIVAVSTLLLAYLFLSHHGIVARTIVIGCTLYALRAFTAYELYRHADGRSFYRFFATFMSVYAFFGLLRIHFTLGHASQLSFRLSDPIQTPTLIANIVLICIAGLLYLSMLSGELMARLEDQSLRDSVSGALNRRGIEKQLAMELVHASQRRHRLAIALIDIDHFKRINDSAGHAAGDDALRRVVAAIDSHVRSYDLVGRYGGDEFLIVLPQTSSRDARRVTERIALALRNSSSNNHEITLSIGITQAAPEESCELLLARADKALYIAKRAGRDCTRIVLLGDDENLAPFAQPETIFSMASGSRTAVQ